MPKMKKGNVLLRLLKYITSHFKMPLILIVIAIIISSVCHVYGQLFMQTLIDDYITPLIGTTNPDYQPLLMAIGLMAFVYLIGVIFTLVQTRLVVNVGQGVLKQIRMDMFQHMETLPIKYFDDNSHGDIMSYYINDTDALRDMISQTIPNGVSNGIIILFTFISMLTLNIYLTITIVIGVIGMLIVARSIGKRSSLYFRKRQKSVAEVNGYIEEMIDGQKVIKVFTHEEEAKKEFDRYNEELFENTKKANIYANMLMPVMGNIGYLLYVIIATCGGFIAIQTNSLSIGAIASFLLLTRSFTMHVNQLSQQYNSLALALAGAARIFGLLDERSESNEGTVTLVNVVKNKDGTLQETKDYTGTWAWKEKNTHQLIELKGDIRFENVDFAYTPEKTVLKNISLYAKSGQKIAFVGSTGAGKTTITNLINRFYDIKEGTILYDGIDVKKINKNDLRRSLGMVLQDVNLFTGTIMENLRYGRMDATDEECIAAAKLANADAFIEKLPQGYQTMITDNGENISQGQRQLLSIARCAVSNPPVMILDEATSSIDTRTEKEVQEGMDKLMEGRTVFVIAHRLSTVRNAKAIIVLENGTIIERGNHEDLIKQKGKYYQLYTGAFELE